MNVNTAPFIKKSLLPMVIVFWSSFAGAAENAASGVDQGTESSEGIVIEEIIVTAQKREESIQNIPIAISALTDKNLKNAGIESPREIIGTVPGLVMTANHVSSGLYMRGIGSNAIRSGF